MARRGDFPRPEGLALPMAQVLAWEGQLHRRLGLVVRLLALQVQVLVVAARQLEVLVQLQAQASVRVHERWL